MGTEVYLWCLKNTVMDYNRLVSVTGLGGLYELLSSKADGGVVKSLEDKSTKFVSTRLHSFSHLESIEVFTVKDNVNLADVFTAMQKSYRNSCRMIKRMWMLLKLISKKYILIWILKGCTTAIWKKWSGGITNWWLINGVEIKLSESPEQDGANTRRGNTKSEGKWNQTRVACRNSAA